MRMRLPKGTTGGDKTSQYLATTNETVPRTKSRSAGAQDSMQSSGNSTVIHAMEADADSFSIDSFTSEVSTTGIECLTSKDNLTQATTPASRIKKRQTTPLRELLRYRVSSKPVLRERKQLLTESTGNVNHTSKVSRSRNQICIRQVREQKSEQTLPSQSNMRELASEPCSTESDEYQRRLTASVSKRQRSSQELPRSQSKQTIVNTNTNLASRLTLPCAKQNQKLISVPSRNNSLLKSQFVRKNKFFLSQLVYQSKQSENSMLKTRENSIKSVYEQLGDTRLMSGRNITLTNGKHELKQDKDIDFDSKHTVKLQFSETKLAQTMRVVTEQDFATNCIENNKNPQSQRRRSRNQSLIPFTKLLTGTATTKYSALKLNSNNINMMESQNPIITSNQNAPIRRYATQTQAARTPTSTSIFLAGVPNKTQAKQRVSPLNKSAALKQPQFNSNSQHPLAKSKSSQLSQTLGSIIKSNLGMTQNSMGPTSAQIATNQLPYRRKNVQEYMPIANRRGDRDSIVEIDGSGPDVEIVNDEIDATLFLPNNQFYTARTRQSTLIQSAKVSNQTVQSQSKIPPSGYGLQRQSQQVPSKRQQLYASKNDSNAGISANDFDVVQEMLEGTHMNNIQIKKAKKEVGVPIQRHQSTMQAIQNEGVQSFLNQDESHASVINAANINRNIQTEEQTAYGYNTVQRNKNNSRNRQRCADRFSPVPKSPRGKIAESIAFPTAVQFQKMYTQPSPSAKNSGLNVKQLQNCSYSTTVDNSNVQSPRVQINHHQQPPVSPKKPKTNNSAKEQKLYQPVFYKGNTPRIDKADTLDEETKRFNSSEDSNSQPNPRRRKDSKLSQVNVTPESSLIDTESNSEAHIAQSAMPLGIGPYPIKSPSHMNNKLEPKHTGESEDDNPFELVMVNTIPKLQLDQVEPEKEKSRNKNQGQIYTYTYNESPMSKEHQTPQIKSTVVRSTRLNDQTQPQMSQMSQVNTAPTKVLRSSNICPLPPPQLPSPSSRYGLAKQRSGTGTFKVAYHSDYNSQPSLIPAKIIQNSSTHQNVGFRPPKPSNRNSANMFTSKVVKQNEHSEAQSSIVESAEDSQPGMFNNLMKSIGTMFTTPDPSTQLEQHQHEEQINDAPENLQPSVTDVSVNIEDGNESDNVHLPTQRFGRICDCPKDPEYTSFCSKARAWYEMTSSRSMSLAVDTNAKYAKLKETYKSLYSVKGDDESMAQIERDLGRTFPKHPYYMEEYGGKGHNKLRRVLIAFSNYDNQVDYVQGMNFIVAQLLLHCSETFAFWLFVALIEDCEMRDIYLPKLPGLFKHSQMLELLIKCNLPKLEYHLIEHNIRAQMYASEWIFGLFASVIPCEHMHLFLDKFFKHKWVFFYSLILTILKKHEDQILNEEDFYCIIHQIKAQQFKASGLNQIKTSKAMITSVEKEKQSQNPYEELSPHASISDTDSVMNEIGDETEPRSMFNVFRKFISTNLGMAEEVGVTSTNFWPQMIEKCGSEFPQMYKQPGILRLLHEFDSERLQFVETIPEKPAQIIALLNK